MRSDIPALCRRVVAKISADVANFVRVLSIYRLLQKWFRELRHPFLPNQN